MNVLSIRSTLLTATLLLTGTSVPAQEKDPIILAHRGGAYEFEENTMEGFRACYERGIRGFETDVRMTKDGVLVILHDDTLDRTHNATGSVENMTAAQLRDVTTKKGQKMLFLDELLAYFAHKPDIYIEWEMKTSNKELYPDDRIAAYCQKLHSAAEQQKAKGATYVYSSFDERPLRAIDAIDPKTPMSLIASKPCSAEFIQRAKDVGADRIACQMKGTSRAAVQEAQKAGLMVNGWPGRGAQDYYLAIGLGLDVHCTDVPVAVIGTKERLKYAETTNRTGSLMVRYALALASMFVLLSPQSLVSQDALKPALSSQQLTTLPTPELLSRFESAEFDWQQAEIGRQLVSRGDLSVLSRIEELSRVDDRKRRSNAAFVLDGLGDQRGLEILIAEVRDTKLRAVKSGDGRGNNRAAHQVIADRYYAAQLLGDIGREPAIPALVELLKEEQLAYIAAISLGRLGVRAAIPDILEMANRFPQHRDEAAASLAMLGDARGLDMLVKSIETSEHYAVRCRAIDALRLSGSVKQQPALLKALEDPHANVRVCAARALQAVGDSQALPSLRKAATDKTVPPWHAPTTVSTEAIAAIEAIEGRSQ